MEYCRGNVIKLYTNPGPAKELDRGYYNYMPAPLRLLTERDNSQFLYHLRQDSQETPRVSLPSPLECPNSAP